MGLKQRHLTFKYFFLQLDNSLSCGKNKSIDVFVLNLFSSAKLPNLFKTNSYRYLRLSITILMYILVYNPFTIISIVPFIRDMP